MNKKAVFDRIPRLETKRLNLELPPRDAVLMFE